jgi:RNA polymerase sigma-70 factor (ECF subfamily)
LWAKIERDHLTSAEGAAPEPTLDGTLPPVPSSVVELAWAHRRELFALARRVTGDRHLAEDAVQDALLGVHKYGPSKDPDRPFLPWLRAVVLNAARTRVRKKAPAPQSDRLPDPADDRADHEGVVERAELFARIKAATWELEPLSRKVFRLCYLDGLTHAEVARRVRRKVGSVQGLVCRARKALRARLALPPEPAIG